MFSTLSFVHRSGVRLPVRFYDSRQSALGKPIFQFASVIPDVPVARQQNENNAGEEFAAFFRAVFHYVRFTLFSLFFFFYFLSFSQSINWPYSDTFLVFAVRTLPPPFRLFKLYADRISACSLHKINGRRRRRRRPTENHYSGRNISQNTRLNK